MKSSTPIWKRLRRFCAITVGVILILFVLFAVWLSWSGWREWQQTKSELLARGEKLSIFDFIPPAVPDDQNFYGDPAWMELADLVDTVSPEGWPLKTPRLAPDKLQLAKLDPPLTKNEIAEIKERFPKADLSDLSSRRRTAFQIFNTYTKTGSEQDKRAAANFVLQLLAPSNSMADHVAELAKRPFARFPLVYQDDFPAQPHLTYILNCIQIFGLRAKANLVTGNRESAFNDVMLLLRMSYTLENEPILISMLVRIAIINFALVDIDMGIKSNQWSDGDLTAFEAALSKFNLIRDLANTRRGERGGFNSKLERMVLQGDYRTLGLISSQKESFMPKVWWRLYEWLIFRSDLAFFNRVQQHDIDNFDKASRTGFLIDDRNYEEAILHTKEALLQFYHHPFSLIAFGGVFPTRKKAAMTQDQIIQTRIACALDRYWIKNGSYPETLSTLVPDFMVAIPNDLLTGKPMIYRRTAPDKFLLYSVGWDRMDDGGIPTIRDKPTGDWVWGTVLR